MARTRKPFKTVYILYTGSGEMTEYTFTSLKAIRSFIKTEGEEGDVIVTYTLNTEAN